VDNEFDRKVHARLRREKKLSDLKDGLFWGDRTIPSKAEYKRSLKHRPQTAEEWEELEF
jgi:hypothetical protein